MAIVGDTTTGNQFTYTSRELDKETGLYFYRARYYDPMNGRFTSEDPIGFLGMDLNLFRYVTNNPTNLIDPKGLLFWGLINAGEIYGQEAVEYYAQIAIDPCASEISKFAALTGGLFASLWTPETSDKTFWTLFMAAGLRAPGIGKPIPVEPIHIGFDIPFTTLNLLHYGSHVTFGPHLGILFSGPARTLLHLYVNRYVIIAGAEIVERYYPWLK